MVGPENMANDQYRENDHLPLGQLCSSTGIRNILQTIKSHSFRPCVRLLKVSFDQQTKKAQTNHRVIPFIGSPSMQAPSDPVGIQVPSSTFIHNDRNPIYPTHDRFLSMAASKVTLDPTCSLLYWMPPHPLSGVALGTVQYDDA